MYMYDVSLILCKLVKLGNDRFFPGGFRNFIMSEVKNLETSLMDCCDNS